MEIFDKTRTDPNQLDTAHFQCNPTIEERKITPIIKAKTNRITGIPLSTGNDTNKQNPCIRLQGKIKIEAIGNEVALMEASPIGCRSWIRNCGTAQTSSSNVKIPAVDTDEDVVVVATTTCTEHGISLQWKKDIQSNRKLEILRWCLARIPWILHSLLSGLRKVKRFRKRLTVHFV